MNSQREAIVRLVISSPAGQESHIEAVLDTGYTGSLTLPAAVVASLGLPFRGRGSALLGDGSESEFDIHEATIIWAGERRLAAIDVAETDPLLGIGLLLGNELMVQVMAGGAVAIRKLRVA
ncbi:MAG TPA: clan AA aspartic protease [Thermoanaerobaculia bacterium]|nr:clan AA aspartic protease [Thermoanaerobaculia bacterium]